MVAAQVAEIVVTLADGAGLRGSGYRAGPDAVLTAAHVVEDAASVRVRFEADLPGEWTADVVSRWVDPPSDLAVLSIAPRAGEPAVAVARFGRIGADRVASLPARTVGFPRFKLKDAGGVDDDPRRYRDSHQADGSAAVLSNWREGTLEVTVTAPGRDPDPAVSPWEGMSGAAVWVGDRIVGVIAKHHRLDGLGRLAAARLDRALANLDPGRRAELRALLGLPEVLPDVVPPSASDWVIAAYRAQARDIAPDVLLDRDTELDELVRFCAGDRPYAWWQAGPWAGKSALLAWFVSHPPAGVDVVSFFVTARLDGQSDSNACTAALIEQLAALAHEPPASVLTAGAQRGVLLQLLEDAAGRSWEGGRRLLVVIDGLDEDSGAATGSSIASLLPRRLPPGVRVLVASRPLPSLPDNIADDHPLRTLTPRLLDVSQHARAVEHRASHELRRLLTGEPLHRDVLGLITAAGGGLTLGDLAELTEAQRFQIEELLDGVFGRILSSRTGPPSAGYPGDWVYLFAHETLRVVAEQRYGTAGVDAYRDRLHQWAADYQQRGWPAGTPLYLLRGYPHLLAGIGDVPRLVACATDQTRHDRMRRLTGGDALAFTEISVAQQCILDQPAPYLTSLALLAVERDHLTSRNVDVPTELPAVWARLGQVTRAEGLAAGIGTLGALRGLIVAVAAGGDRDRAARLADEAETLIGQDSEPYPRAYALAGLAETAATTDDHGRVSRLADEAEMLIGQVSDPDGHSRALARLAEAVAAGGDHDRAESLVVRITDPYTRADALARLALAVATNGDHARAAGLTGEAEARLGQITDPDRREWPLAWLAEAMVLGGDHDRAAALAGQIDDLGSRAEAIAGLSALTAAGSPDRAARFLADAEVLVEEIAFAPIRVGALAAIVAAAAAKGDHARAAQMAQQAETWIGQIDDDADRTRLVTRLAEAIAAGGDHTLIRRLSDPSERAKRDAWTRRMTRLSRSSAAVSEALRGLAGQAADPPDLTPSAIPPASTLATVSEQDRAELLIRRFSEPDDLMSGLARLAHLAVVTGDRDRAARLADEVEAGGADRFDPDERAQSLARLAEAVAAAGEPDRAVRIFAHAQTLLGQITDPDRRRHALAVLMAATNASGDYERTTRLAGQAEQLIERIVSADSRADAYARLAETVATAGSHDRAARLFATAEALVEQALPDESSLLDSRAEAVAGLARAVVAMGGDHDRAAQLINSAEALVRRVTYPDDREQALGRLAGAIATGGDAERAETLTRRITDLDVRVGRLTEFVKAAAARGDDARAARLAGEAEALIGQIADPTSRTKRLAGLVAAVAASGEHDRAARLADEATAVARTITVPIYRTEATAGLAEAVAMSGDRGRAVGLVDEVETLAGQVDWSRSFGGPGWLLNRLAATLAACGDHDSAGQYADLIAEPGIRVQTLAQLMEVAATADDHHRAARLTDEAETLLTQINRPEHHAEAMARLVTVVAVRGDPDRAARLISTIETSIGQITDADWQVKALAQLAGAAATSGDAEKTAQLADKAESLLGQTTFPEWRAEGIAGLVRALTAVGSQDRADRLIAEETAFTEQITELGWRVVALSQLVEAVAATGDHARFDHLALQTEMLIGQITYSDHREQALALLVGVTAAEGDVERAEELAAAMTNPHEQAGALAQLAEAVAAAGDHARAARLADRVETLVGQMTDPNTRLRILTRLVGAVAIGDEARAGRLAAETEALIEQITHAAYQSAATAELVETLVKAATKTSPVPGPPPSTSPLTIRARRLVATALAVGSWPGVVVSLARIDPSAVIGLADTVQERWQLDNHIAGDQAREAVTIPAEAVKTPRAPRRARGFLRRLRNRE